MDQGHRDWRGLAEARNHNHLILASIADGVHVLDREGRVIFENPAAQAMLGYGEEELLGTFAHDHLHHHRPDGRPYAVEECPIYRTLADGRTRHALDEHFIRKDGSLLPVEFTAAAMTGEGGAITGVVVTFRDVSGRKRDEALRALESRVLESIAGGEPLVEILGEITRTVDQLNPEGMSSVLLVDEGGRLRQGAAPGLPPAWSLAIDGLAIGPDTGSCGTAAHRREMVIVTDIATDPLWRPFRDLATAHGLRACWSVPVLVAPDQVAATFAIYYREPRAPAPWEEEFIHRIAGFLRVAFERSRQNERLRASELRFRSIYDLVPVSIWEEDWSEVIALFRRLRNAGIRNLDQYFNDHPAEVEHALSTVRILSFNDVTLRMFDAGTREEVLASMAELTASRSARRTLKAKLLALAHGDSGFEAVMTLRTVKGRRVEGLLNVAFPPPDSDSGLVLASVMDITSRRRAEERFRIVAQATNDVIWDWNLPEDTLWWSDGMERLFGHSLESLPPDSRSWTGNIHPEDRERVINGIHGVIDGGGNDWTDEYRFARADGGWSLIRDRGLVIRDSEGRPIRMVGSMVDITEQRALETQLHQAQRLDAIGQLTGGIAHDFNNLLTVILGSSELLLDGLTHDPRLRAMADMTRSAALRGSELTNRLLAFARQQPLDPKAVNVNHLVADMDPLLRRTLGEQVELEIVRRGGLWNALVDASQLENAILNLCINARDAMPSGGRITIEAANEDLDETRIADLSDVPPGQYVLVTVSDTGTGMDRDTLARVFEPFFTTKEVGKGSGLGLSMVYGFVKQSRGHVRISSEPGRGTTVRLYLPRADGPTLAEPVRRPTGPAPGGSERILLVEDDDLVRSYVERQLRSMGYSVVSARNGPEALEQLREQAPFDLLFTDVIMPGGLSGQELAARARAVHPDLPVLFTSGYTENTIVHHGRLDRGVHLLRKPYRRDEMATKVRMVLDEGRRKRPDA
jgi:PAS domain S-box-containing protein